MRLRTDNSASPNTSTDEQTASADSSAPLISVVIPSYNCGEYIAETISSVLKQSYGNFEILIMDGGSTDRTRQIVEGLNQSKLTFVQEPDRGQLDAVLKGIDRAKGDILFWLNADDIVLPGAFEHVIDIFKANEGIDVVYADSFAFDAERREIYVSPLIRGLGDLDHLLFYRQFYSECVYWRKALKAEIPDDQKAFRVCTDYAFFLRLKWGKRLFWTPKRLGAFRIRSAQMSNSYVSRHADEFRSIRERLQTDLGFSAAHVLFLRVIHAPSFFIRLVVLPNCARVIRWVYRRLTGDRDRKDLSDLFYAWVEESSERVGSLEGENHAQ